MSYLTARMRSASQRGAGSLRSLPRAAACALLLASIASCSLVSIKSPEKPLSARDLNARLLTHEYSAHFIAAVEQTADQISAPSPDPERRTNALRWNIAAAAKRERAASQVVPMMGRVET